MGVSARGSARGRKASDDLILPVERVEPLDLSQAYIVVQERLNRSAQHYLEDKIRKRRWSRLLRLLAIVFGVGGGLVPFISQVWVTVPLEVGYLLLALAAGLQLLDRGFGFTDGWLRSVSAAMAIQARSSALELEFSDLVAQGRQSEAWAALRSASRDAWLVVETETAAWVSEFGTATNEVRQGLATPRP